MSIREATVTIATCDVIDCNAVYQMWGSVPFGVTMSTVMSGGWRMFDGKLYCPQHAEQYRRAGGGR